MGADSAAQWPVPAETPSSRSRFSASASSPHGSVISAQALHMDPDDASAWSYHRWLLDGVMQNLVQARSYSSSSDDSREVEERSVKAQLLSELAACEGIVEAESQAGRGQAACPGTKWPIITMAHICGLLRQLLDQVRCYALLSELLSGLVTCRAPTLTELAFCVACCEACRGSWGLHWFACCSTGLLVANTKEESTKQSRQHICVPSRR